MPTLLQINAALNTGSTGRIAEQIGDLAAKEGWHVIIAHGARYKNKSNHKTYQISFLFEEYIHWVKSFLFDSHGLSSSYGTKKLIKFIKKIKPDIIHIHNLHGYYVNYKLLFEYLNKTNIPLVWTFHDCWPYTGHCVYYSKAQCGKWKSAIGCANCEFKGDYPNSLIDRASRNYVLKKEMFTSCIENLSIVSVSDWLSNEIKQSFFRNAKIYTIYNGVDTNKFYPKSLEEVMALKIRHGLVGCHVLLGCANVFDERKGYSDYLKLSLLLPSNYKIVMIGLQKSKIKEVSKYNILGIPKTESIDELATWYSLADVTLSLSREETFGMTPVEGFACGTPAIVYNSTASPELISPDTGYVVECGDISKVADFAKLLVLEKSKLSQNCINRALRLFNKEDKYREYIDLYNRLL